MYNSKSMQSWSGLALLGPPLATSLHTGKLSTKSYQFITLAGSNKAGYTPTVPVHGPPWSMEDSNVMVIFRDFDVGK